MDHLLSVPYRPQTGSVPLCSLLPSNISYLHKHPCIKKNHKQIIVLSSSINCNLLKDRNHGLHFFSFSPDINSRSWPQKKFCLNEVFWFPYNNKIYWSILTVFKRSDFKVVSFVTKVNWKSSRIGGSEYPRIYRSRKKR